MPHHTLDTTGLNCPLPVLKTKKKVKELNNGDILEVTATDPASTIDFDHYCHVAGHKLISQQENDGVFLYVIEIAGK